MTYTYLLSVDEHADGTFTAYLDLPDSPLRGHGESPLQAIRALCETLREWPVSGAKRWLDTPAGTRLARQFVPGFEPGEGGDPS